jgi:hypothetical protein
MRMAVKTLVQTPYIKYPHPFVKLIFYLHAGRFPLY